MRLFVAIDFNEDSKDELSAYMAKVRGRLEKGRMTRRENLHLTLAFLGETDKRLLPEIGRSMEEAARGIKGFEIGTGRPGRFRRRGGDILWLGLEACPPLMELERRLSGALRSCGFELEERAFNPHLTLAREAVLSEGADIAEVMEGAPAVILRVTEIALMNSGRISGKLTYTPVARAPLS